MRYRLRIVVVRTRAYTDVLSADSGWSWMVTAPLMLATSFGSRRPEGGNSGSCEPGAVGSTYVSGSSHLIRRNINFPEVSQAIAQWARQSVTGSPPSTGNALMPTGCSGSDVCEPAANQRPSGDSPCISKIVSGDIFWRPLPSAFIRYIKFDPASRERKTRLPSGRKFGESSILWDDNCLGEKRRLVEAIQILDFPFLSCVAKTTDLPSGETE